MRNMSFSMTTPQFLDGTKDVTRRNGWWKLKAGDKVMAVEKAMGLKKGEKIKPLGMIEIVSVRLERLDEITQEDVVREGFPEMTRQEFCKFFMRGHNGVMLDSFINRIEFKKVSKK